MMSLAKSGQFVAWYFNERNQSSAHSRSGDQAKMSGLGFDGDVRVEARGFGLDVMIHERLPFLVEGDAAQVQQRLGTGQGPVHPRPFHPVLHDVAAGPDGTVYVGDAIGQRVQKFVCR